MLVSLIKLTKPGVLIGNAITVPAGFLLASNGVVDWSLLWWAFSGSSLIIASACVLNNVFDRDIDQKMERTKTRPMVNDQVPTTVAVAFCIVLGLVGLGILIHFTNILVVIIGIIGFIDYVWLYGVWTKRTTYHGTLVGSISGAVPILAGYVAASGIFDVGALLVFLVLFFWQQPEFYAISIYRRDEYAAAGVPVISVVKGNKITVRHIFGHIIAFTVTCLALYFTGYASYVFAVIMATAAGYWLWLGWQGFTASDLDRWSRQMFRYSLIVLLLFCLLASIDGFLPV